MLKQAGPQDLFQTHFFQANPHQNHPNSWVKSDISLDIKHLLGYLSLKNGQVTRSSKGHREVLAHRIHLLRGRVYQWNQAISLRVDQPLKRLEKLDEDQGPSCQGTVFCWFFQVIIRCFSHVEPPEDCESPTQASRYVFFAFRGDWLRNLHHSKSFSHGWEASPAKYLFCHWICQTQTMERSGTINTTAIGNRGT